MNEPQTQVTNESSVKNGWRIFSSFEGIVLAVAIGLALLGLVVIGILALISPDLSGIIGSMVFANLTLGRSISLLMGYAAGQGHMLVIGVNMLTETVLVLLFFPLFVFSLRQLPMFPKLQSVIDRVHLHANRHKDAVYRYGVIGVFAFVWFPFWMTGPVIGCAIGCLIGLRPLVNLLAVLSGTFIAMLFWAGLLYNLHTQTQAFGSWGLAFLFGLLLAIVAVGYWFNLKRVRRASESNQEP